MVYQREVPPMLFHYDNQTRAMYEKLVILSVLTIDAPEVAGPERIEIVKLGHGVYRICAHYGFMESPDIPQIMSPAKAKGLDINLNEVTYNVGRLSMVRDPKKTMPRWRRFLFMFLLRNSLSGSSYLNIPPSKVMEIGIRMQY